MTDVTDARADVLIVGAGLAGLAAASALAGDGARVTLLDRRPAIGGRAYSYLHPALEETVDSQHVVLGCCTNLVDLITQAGTPDSIRWYDDLIFLEPATARTGAQTTILRPGVLPAPAHQAVSFLRAPMLGLRDKAVIAAGLAHFLRGYPAHDTKSFADWLTRTHQTPRAIRHFWEPVVLGALNDTLDRCSLKYAAKIFHESFLRSPEAGRLGIPAGALSDFLAPVATLAQTQGADLLLKTAADRISFSDGVWNVHSGEASYIAPNLILALDFKQSAALLNTLPPDHDRPNAIDPAHFTAAPITTVHLWYDRDVTLLDHAALLDTRIQWVFNKTRIRRRPPGTPTYLELTISASWPELRLSPAEILASALNEFHSFFPQARAATLLKSTVLKEARATFSVSPGLDRFRPTQRTALPGLYLAGDWTATEWPSTMESAVRSGRLAAGAVTSSPHGFLAPELPATGLMKWLSR